MLMVDDEREHEPLDQRVQLMMGKSELAAIDDWAWTRRIRARADAIRQLVRAGIDATAPDAPEATPEPAKKPRRKPA